MTKNRLEAFSDGVIAILITIMVLELKVPHGADWHSISPLLPKFLSYVLSFIFVGIYWNNHHHLLHAAEKVSGGILWANLHLLFWLSLIPVSTGWMGENENAALPTAMYGVVLLGCALAYTGLQLLIVRKQGAHSKLHEAVSSGVKEKLSLVAYLLAIPAAFLHPLIADALYVFVAALWLIPDTRIERALEHGHDAS